MVPIDSKGGGCAHLFHLLVELATRQLHHQPAAQTDEMMVVVVVVANGVPASSAATHVSKHPNLGQRFQGAEDRGPSDVRMGSKNLCLDLRRSEEVAERESGLHDYPPRSSDATAAFS
jgi:hypothetical protein